MGDLERPTENTQRLGMTSDVRLESTVGYEIGFTRFFYVIFYFEFAQVGLMLGWITVNLY